MKEVYLDFQASTPLDPRVLDLMMPWLAKAANPHATENQAGREAADAVEDARVKVAKLVEARPSDVVFTSGATEAANIVLRSFGPPGSRIIHSSIEHPCVFETASALALAGADVGIAEVDDDGLLDMDRLEGMLATTVALVSVMAVNNEIGTVQPIREIAQLSREVGALFHTDAAQGAGRIPLVIGRDFDIATLSGHKIYGPQGIGAIIAIESARDRLKPIALGGGQESGLRPGTVPVALVVGMGEACRLAAEEMNADRDRVMAAAHVLLTGLGAAGHPFVVHGSTQQRVPHNLNLSFPGIASEDLLARLPGLALSTGSACSAGSLGPSRVLAAIGVDHDLATGAIRIGFGRTTSLGEAEYAARCLAEAVEDALKVGRKRSGS